MSAVFAARKDGLYPAAAPAYDALAALDLNELVDVDILRERDSAFRRFVFAAFNQVAKAADIAPQQLRVDLLVKSGRYQQVTLPTGKVVLVVASMKRQAMSDKELREFWVDAREMIVAMLPRFSPQDRQEIDAMLKGGGTYGDDNGEAAVRGARGDHAPPRVSAPRRAAPDERGHRSPRDRADGGDP